MCWDFNVHHKDCLTHSGGTDRPGELYYDFSISNDLILMVTLLLKSECDSHRSALLDLLFSSDAIQWLPFTGEFLLSGCLSFYWLSAKLKTDAQFHRIAYDYFYADWDGLHQAFTNCMHCYNCAHNMHSNSLTRTEKSCTVLTPLYKNKLNLPIYLRDHYALRK